MEIEEKLKFLQKELDARILEFKRKRNGDKQKAFGLKILAVSFAATITVLLGLKVEGDWAKILQSVALLLGALITVLNAVEAFYDHRSLWIRRTYSLARLYALKADLSFTVAGMEVSEIDVKIITKFMDRYENILQDDLKAWLRQREVSTPADKSTTTTST
jgi:hypothetical protein